MCVQFSGHFPLLFVGPEIHWRILKQKIETAVLRIFNFGHFREIHLLFLSLCWNWKHRIFSVEFLYTDYYSDERD